MNIRDFVIQRGPDEDVGTLADAYLKEALAIKDEEERKAALVPAVRQLVSSVASSLRKAQRGPAWSWPRPGQARTYQTGHTPPPTGAEVGEEPEGGRESWLAWLRDNDRAMYFIPGTGSKLMLDITDAEWDRRASWYEQQARGTLREAVRCRNFAGFLRENGVITARELFGE